MASLSRDPTSGNYRIHFRFGGRQYQKSLKTDSEKDANALKGRVELTLLDLERGRLTLPPNGDIWQFVLSDGKRAERMEAPQVLTLERLFSRYETEMPAGTMEANSLATCRLHKKHLLRIFGKRTPAPPLRTTDLQRYVNARAKEKYRDKPISSRTIKKEVATFRAVWNWGKLHGLVVGDSPVAGLKYEKEDLKQPFQTWGTIERQVARGGLTEDQRDALWDTLFLDRHQIADCLEHVKEKAKAPFVYPMFVFVAHTGARRSEMMRSRVEDFDFATKLVCIREKKRDRSVKETRRYVEMTPLLERVLKAWLAGEHPGGPYTFCHGDVVSRSRKRSRTTGHQSEKTRATTSRGRLSTVCERTERRTHEPLTRKEATYHFKRALAGSKWQVVRGFHVFRHSFASNLAVAGAGQDTISKLMGHQTEEMRRRYRHLFPHETLDALRKVFGE
jgi:integrase